MNNNEAAIVAKFKSVNGIVAINRDANNHNEFAEFAQSINFIADSSDREFIERYGCHQDFFGHQVNRAKIMSMLSNQNDNLIWWRYNIVPISINEVRVNIQTSLERIYRNSMFQPAQSRSVDHFESISQEGYMAGSYYERASATPHSWTASTSDWSEWYQQTHRHDRSLLDAMEEGRNHWQRVMPPPYEESEEPNNESDETI